MTVGVGEVASTAEAVAVLTAAAWVVEAAAGVNGHG